MTIDRNLSNHDLGLIAVLRQTARLRHENIDLNEVRALLSQDDSIPNGVKRLDVLAKQMSWPQAHWRRKPDPARLPCIMATDEGYAIVVAMTTDGGWIVNFPNFETRRMDETLVQHLPAKARFTNLSFRIPFKMRKSRNLRLIMAEVFSHKFILSEVILSSLVLTLIGVSTSLFAMQVYDRVLPTSAYSTLLVLGLGMGCAILLDFIGKWSRANLLRHLSSEVDQNLARSTFTRFLGVRLNRLPESVGLMAQKLREYETVRNYIVAQTTFLFADLPLAIGVGLVLFAIGHELVLIPLVAVLIGLLTGVIVKRRLTLNARDGAEANLRKSGLLIEVLHGAETIKAGFSGWRMLSRWLDITDQTRQIDDRGKDISGNMQLFIGFLSQMSYMLLIVYGALMVGDGKISMGGLIACSILSQRLMGPVATIPNLIVSSSFAKSSLRSLDDTWALPQDLDEDANVIQAEGLLGRYSLDNVELYYHGTRALSVSSLKIQAGDRIGLIGSIGSGKTSLLKILAGLYRPDEGLVLLEDMDMFRLDRQTLTDHIGYVSQDGHLFGGTLRDNLLLGLLDPGDTQILQVARDTGLYEYVIATHPDGLDRRIAEGGAGLSGGQKQLVLLTRAFLREPSIWLLDEPTASVDFNLENIIQNALTRYIKAHPNVTMIIASHKQNILALTNRVIVLSGGNIQMDGPKDETLTSLRSLAEQQRAQNAKALHAS